MQNNPSSTPHLKYTGPVNGSFAPLGQIKVVTLRNFTFTGVLLLQYLDWNDVLRFRRVCKWTLEIANGYLREYPDRSPEREIREEKEKNLEAFLDLGIPTTKLFINNQSGTQFYDLEDSSGKLAEFMEDHGHHIKSRVIQLTLCPFAKELKFLESLINLKTFECGYLTLGPQMEEYRQQAFATGRLIGQDKSLVNPFPKSFKSLENIKIGQDNKDTKVIHLLKQTGTVFQHCPQLKHAKLPFHCPTPPVKFDVQKPGFVQNGSDEEFGTLGRDLYFLNEYLGRRPTDAFPDHPPTVMESYDFANYRFPYEDNPWVQDDVRAAVLPAYSASVACFIKTLLECISHHEHLREEEAQVIKLYNVNPLWLSGRWFENHDVRDRASPMMGIAIASMTNLDNCVHDLDFRNLEKLVIPFTSRCISGLRRPEWPVLSCVDITVDSQIGKAWDVTGHTTLDGIKEISHQPTKDLFKFLWGGYDVQEAMTEFSLKFVEGNAESRMGIAKEVDMKWRKRERKMVAWVGDGDVALPRMEMIATSCPNLRRIKIGGWPGKNKQLLKLWERLPRLEEVELEGCREVGNVTFVGEDKERPEFFKLKNLKKLTLKGLDDMPKITDLVFEMVLAKMKLKELVLTSEFPVENVTKAGIEALLQGPFNETIEKFSFKGWTLAGVDAEEFEELGKRFRSYKML